MRFQSAACLISLVSLVVARTAGADTPAAPAPAVIAAPRLGGYVQERETWQSKVGLTSTLNRVRLSADGPLPDRLTYRVTVELEAGGSARTAATPSLRDAYIRWTANDRLALQAGQFKTPFSRTYLTSITLLETKQACRIKTCIHACKHGYMSSRRHRQVSFLEVPGIIFIGLKKFLNDVHNILLS